MQAHWKIYFKGNQSYHFQVGHQDAFWNRIIIVFRLQKIVYFYPDATNIIIKVLFGTNSNICIQFSSYLSLIGNSYFRPPVLYLEHIQFHSSNKIQWQRAYTFKILETKFQTMQSD